MNLKLSWMWFSLSRKEKIQMSLFFSVDFPRTKIRQQIQLSAMAWGFIQT